MKERLDFYKASPEGIKAMVGLEQGLAKLGLDPKLLDLVKLRASQINGCAYCVDLHSSDLRKEGETDQRLFGLTVWRETPFYTPRERAALAWTEALTLISQTHAPDAEYEALAEQFDERERVNLTLAIGAINTWNRLAIRYRKLPATK